MLSVLISNFRSFTLNKYVNFSDFYIQTGQQARFDFQGNLIPADAEIPVHFGLHHHGEEPEV